MMIQGSKGQEFDAGLLAGEFLRIAGSPKKRRSSRKTATLKRSDFLVHHKAPRLRCGLFLFIIVVNKKAASYLLSFSTSQSNS